MKSLVELFADGLPLTVVQGIINRAVADGLSRETMRQLAHITFCEVANMELTMDQRQRALRLHDAIVQQIDETYNALS